MGSDSLRFWHGGAPGLAVGDRIIPRSQLPDDNYDKAIHSTIDPTDTGRVYLTTNTSFAIGWALRYAHTPFPDARHGTVYEVRPEGTVDIDTDFPAEAGSWHAPSAVIIGIYRRRVRGSERDRRKRISCYTTWSDSTPVYTSDGFLLPAPEWRAQGITADELRRFGRWPARENLAAHNGAIIDTTNHLDDLLEREFFLNYVRNNRIVGPYLFRSSSTSEESGNK